MVEVEACAQALARRQCAGEGWDPDEIIDYEGSFVPGAAGSRGPRWGLYLTAAQQQLAREADWETF
ncbi:hypothetical protein [Phenylobacterium sp. J367]|uniref:hypothetical protein n=1 Tax=Phenylobacterium sp. J367 TaxID=2898435 RepID=UPI002151C3D0|nr:hypothetical protein [Phenylobacterium sp. J367]MCR5878514.1 hypothetical protein [Phenylobacterium sp. J367]